MISIIIKSFLKSLTLLLPLVILSACQSIPLLQHKTDPSLGIEYDFSLLEDQSVFGYLAEVEIEQGDSLPLLARYFGLGFDEITNANPGIDPWIPRSSDTITLPSKFILPNAPRKGLILNLAAKRLYYFPKNKPNRVLTFPIGIGREGWKTPIGTTKIVAKKANPRWVVPNSIRLEHAKKGDPLPKVVAAGPNNPLGDYAIRLGIPGYLIHGTNKPYGVGMAVSHGCVRLYPEDIEVLFKQIDTGTKVRLIHQPFLIGWENDQLYIQIYPETRISNKLHNKQLRSFKKKLKNIEQKTNRNIAWDKVEMAITLNNGIPVPIFINDIKNETVTKFTHPPNLNHQIKPAPLTTNSWRIKVSSFTKEDSAQRLAAMLNHQGPAIPAHVLPGKKEFIVISGPFYSLKNAQKSIARLKIDFSLNPKLIERDNDIPDLQKRWLFF